MSAILALITAMILVVISLARSKRQREHPSQSIIERYLHPGHAWARTTGDGYIVVGVDDFAQSVLGKVTEVKLPRLLQHVSQGKASWALGHGDRSLQMVSPVTGWVVEKNEEVLQDPSLINTSPYGGGWLFKLKSYNVGPQLNNLITGKAVRPWRDAVRTRLSQFFSAGRPALLMQDGGVMVDNLVDRCSDEEWEVLRREFFLAE